MGLAKIEGAACRRPPTSSCPSPRPRRLEWRGYGNDRLGDVERLAVIQVNVLHRERKGPGRGGRDHQVPAPACGEAEGGIGRNHKREGVLINGGHPQGVAVLGDDRGLNSQGVFLDGVARGNQTDEDVLPHLGGHRHP